MNLQEVKETLTKAIEKKKAQGYVIAPRGFSAGDGCRCALECLEGAPINPSKLVRFAVETLGVYPWQAGALMEGFDNTPALLGRTLDGREFYALGCELRKKFASKN